MKKIVLSLILIGCLFSLGAILPPEYSALPLQQDPEVITGILDNGLKYYIKQNAKPESELNFGFVLMLAVLMKMMIKRSGSFVEHMAFNGSKNFPRN